MSIILKGTWRDKIEYADGSVVYTDWSSNQVQNTSAILTATLMNETVKPATAPYGGIQYLAVGTGEVSWDASPPVPGVDLAYSATQLETELDRVVIASIEYLDSNDDVVAGPTRKLKIISILTTADAIGDLREFGLFGGNATNTANSGYMINWVAHTKIEKEVSDTITRTITLEWQEQS